MFEYSQAWSGVGSRHTLSAGEDGSDPGDPDLLSAVESSRGQIGLDSIRVLGGRFSR